MASLENGALFGKVAIVTGAARGLGRAHAETLATAGATVIATDRADCADTVASIQAQGGKVEAHKLDVTDMSTAREIADHAVSEFGSIDVLVNNAALYADIKGGLFETLDEAEWDACMDVNVKGIWNCCKAVAPAMRQQKSGSIINIASLAATYGLPFALHYTTSKGAVIGMTRGLARELGREGIRVNAIAPSAVVTEGTRSFFGEKLDRAVGVIRDGQSIKQTVEAQDIADAMLYLASDASRMVTGQTLMVDGGTTFL